MADTHQQTPEDQQQQSQQGSEQYRDQSEFDTTFLQQISSGQTFGQPVDWAREYFDSIEQQVRSARRVAEVSALAQIKQQIVAQCSQLVRQQVLADLQRDPSLMQKLTGGSSR